MSDLYGQFVTAVAAGGDARFGQRSALIAPVVTVEAIADLDFRVRNFTVDVMALTIPVPDNPVDAEAAVGQQLKLLQFQRATTNFKSRWDTWERQHTGPIERTGEGPMAEFEAFRVEYNELVRQFKSSFGVAKTTAREMKATEKHEAVRDVTEAIKLLSVVAVIGVAAYAYGQIKK